MRVAIISYGYVNGKQIYVSVNKRLIVWYGFTQAACDAVPPHPWPPLAPPGCRALCSSGGLHETIRFGTSFLHCNLETPRTRIGPRIEPKSEYRQLVCPSIRRAISQPCSEQQPRSSTPWPSSPCCNHQQVIRPQHMHAFIN